MDMLFIRHGESYANTGKVFSNSGWSHGLTELGVAQAEEAAGGARDYFGRPDRVYSSGLRRAYETAAIISGRLEAEHRVMPDLAEVSVGVLEGKSDAASWRAHNAVWDRWFRVGDLEARLPGGESLGEAINRFRAVVARLEEEERDGARVVLVSHGGFILAGVLNLVYNVPEFIPRRGHLANCDMLHVRNAGELLTFAGFKAVSVKQPR